MLKRDGHTWRSSRKSRTQSSKSCRAPTRRKARWTTRGYEQTLNGNEDFFSATPAKMHLEMMLVEAALKGHVAAIGDCSGAFYQSPLNPDGTEIKSGSNRLQRQSWDQTTSGKPCLLSQVSRSAKGLGQLQCRNSHEFHADETVTVRWLLVLSFRTKSERIEEKAGRHIDDFLVTGPEPNVERFLEQARDKLNMQDAVRLYKTGDEGRLLAMNLRKLDNGYSLQGKTSSHSQNCHSTRNGEC